MNALKWEDPKQDMGGGDYIEQRAGCRCGACSHVRVVQISEEELKNPVNFVAHLTMVFTRLDGWSEG